MYTTRNGASNGAVYPYPDRPVNHSPSTPNDVTAAPPAQEDRICCWTMRQWVRTIGAVELVWAVLALCVAIWAMAIGRVELGYLFVVAVFIVVSAVLLFLSASRGNVWMLLGFLIWKPIELVVHLIVVTYIGVSLQNRYSSDVAEFVDGRRVYLSRQRRYEGHSSPWGSFIGGVAFLIIYFVIEIFFIYILSSCFRAIRRRQKEMSQNLETSYANGTKQPKWRPGWYNETPSSPYRDPVPYSIFAARHLGKTYSSRSNGMDGRTINRSYSLEGNVYSGSSDVTYDQRGYATERKKRRRHSYTYRS